MQQRMSLYTLDLVWYWVPSIMSLKITPATAATGFQKHKTHSCWSAKLNYAVFAAFEEEYLATLNTCQSADWRACTALVCKHAEQAPHQVEDGLNAMLAIKSAFPVRMRLRRRTAWKITWAWGARASIHATGTATMPRPNAWLVMKSVPIPARMPVAGSAERGDLGK